MFNERQERYGTCSICTRYNTNEQWCKSCDPELLAQSWTSSSHKKLDEIIRIHSLKQKDLIVIFILNGFLMMI